MSTTEINFYDLSNGYIDVTDANNPVWEGSGIFDKMMKAINSNIQLQYDTGRITGAEYSDLYLGSLQIAITESMKFLMNKKSIEKGLEEKEVDILLKENDLNERIEKWQLQQQVLGNQLAMSNIDLENKPDFVAKDLLIKDKQIDSADADIAFNESKKLIMEQTRKDNIRTKAAEQFAEFMKYISAANVVPGPTDFKNMRALVEGINTGIADPDFAAVIVTDTLGADYVNPNPTT